jgi:nucleotide-binding universal stress UspA family protein
MRSLPDSSIQGELPRCRRGGRLQMLFEKIVCAVDGSEEGFVALAQGRQLLAPGGRLVAVTVCEDALAVRAGVNAARIAADMRAEAALTKAKAARGLVGLANSEAMVVRGRPSDALLRIIEREVPDLLVVGSHGTGRGLGMLLGSVATRMLRDAPCPALVARRTSEPAMFPRHIVVGVDGSAHAAQAEAVAADLGERLQATVEAVAASGDKNVDIDAVSHAEVDARGPVAALTAASNSADLLVLGSRGLHGVAALGSVSERVAHRAPCSVLVVARRRVGSAERSAASAAAR